MIGEATTAMVKESTKSFGGQERLECRGQGSVQRDGRVLETGWERGCRSSLCYIGELLTIARN